MSAYTGKSVKAAADFIEGIHDNPLTAPLKVGIALEAVMAMGAVGYVIPAARQWVEDVMDEVDTREENDTLDYLTPWSV